MAALVAGIQRTGGNMAQARMSELERDMQPLAEEIIAAPATSLGGLRAKALVALWEVYGPSISKATSKHSRASFNPARVDADFRALSASEV